MSGYVFAIGDVDPVEVIKKCAETGVYSTNINTLSSNPFEGTLTDYISMRPGDNIYFFCRRKYYGVGELVSVGDDCKYCNYPDSTLRQNHKYEDIADSLLVDYGKDSEKNRWICTFKGAPYMFEEGIDTDEILQYKPSTFKILRAFWKVSFIKLGDEENESLKEIFLLRHQNEMENKSKIFSVSDSVHDSIRKRTLKYLLGTLFLFTGSLIRLQPFFMVCVFGFGIWILKFWNASRQKEYKQFFRYFFCPFVVIFAFILGFSYFEEKIWDISTEELSYFQEYNQVRTELVDYEIPDYQAHQSEYQAMGLSGNDIDNLKRWCFADSDKFSLEVLKQIASMNENSHFSAKEFFKYIRDNIITHTIFKLCVILTFCCLFLAKRKHYGQMLYPHFAFFFVLFYLHYIGRITEWVINSLWITYLLAMIAVVCAHFPDYIRTKKKLLQATVCCLCGSVLFNSDIILSRALTSQPMHTELYQCMNSLSSSKELNFFCDVTCIYDMSRDYRIFDKTPEHFFSNIFFSGAWFSCSPQENYTKKQAGIENIYRDILYKEDYVVLDREAILQKQIYLTENYSPTARYSKIQDLYGYPIYKFSDNYTGVRNESTSDAVLRFVSSENGYHQIFGEIKLTPEELHGATVYLEISDSTANVTTTYAGRFEQTNAHGLYSLRYNNALPETNQITFQLPESISLSSQYQYKLLLRYNNTAQVLSVNWE